MLKVYAKRFDEKIIANLLTMMTVHGSHPRGLRIVSNHSFIEGTERTIKGQKRFVFVRN